MNRRAFALVEAAALLVVAVGVAALLLVFGAEQRRQGRLGEDISKLRTIGELTSQYAADNADLFWNFSWRKGQSLSQYPDLNNATDDLSAAANQAVDILRRVAGREDIPRISAWIPHVAYAHLPLLDYSKELPDETFISAADTHRLKWSRDPRGFDQGAYTPAPPGVPGDPNAKRWPYSSSFQLPTAFYDKSPVSGRISQAGGYNFFTVPSNAVLGGQPRSAVAFPAHKVLLHDSHARHFGVKQPYCTLDPSRLPLLFADGSVHVKGAIESNAGWIPTTPTSAASTFFTYQPSAWEPGTFSGGVSENAIGRFRWTRGFLLGRDFGGPEACTGQPGCP